MNTHIKIILGQLVFLAVALSIVFMLYPKADVNVSGNAVSFSSTNADVIVISENPDFSNPRYIDFGNEDNVSFNLKPGTYYWKPANSFIQGVAKKFTIDSEVGMKISKNNESGNESDLVNVGDVRINVTKTKEGMTIGYIILEPDEGEEINDSDNVNYTGRQDG